MHIAFFSTKSYEMGFYKNKNDIKYDFIEAPLNLEHVEKAAGHDAVCCFTSDDLSKPVLEKLTQFGIKLIIIRATGYDNVDLNAVKSLGMTLCNVPSYSPESIAGFAITLLLNLLRKIPHTAQRISQNDFSLEGLMGETVGSKAIGVIGTGHIGAKLIKILTGFDCKLYACDPIENPKVTELGINYVDQDTLFKTCNVIMLCCPLNPSTHHLINAKTIAKMQEGTIIINVARGPVIDTAALVDALNTGKIIGAGLDVIEGEEGIFFHKHDKSPDHPHLATLLKMPHVIITPHKAFFTKQSVESISKQVDDCLKAFAAHKPINCVL